MRTGFVTLDSFKIVLGRQLSVKEVDAAFVAQRFMPGSQVDRVNYTQFISEFK